MFVIASFFASFSAAGLQKVPVGIIVEEGIALDEFKNSLSGILITKDFANLDDCLNELKQYKQYVCVDITKDIAYHLDVHYDNTKTLVIWGVINQIKTTVDWIKKEKTKEAAERILEQAEKGPQYISGAKRELLVVERAIDDYGREVDSGIKAIDLQARSARTNIDKMSESFSDVNSQLSNLQYSRETSKNNVINNIDSISTYAGYLLYLNPPANQYGMSIGDKAVKAKQELNVYDKLVLAAITSAADEASIFYGVQGNAENALNNLDSGINSLSRAKTGLEGSKNAVSEARNNLNMLEGYVNSFQGIDAESVADPIQMNFRPTYLPEANLKLAEKFKNGEQDEITLLIKGETLLSFQVIFPKILLLIVMFLSLLTSTFICMNYLNSPANNRIMIINKMFFPSFFSVFIAAFFITIIPIIFVILLGNYLFLLPFLSNIILILFVVAISASIYVLIGMSLSYLIKDKSLTLLVSIFILIFLLFFSGFILPIERMGAVPAKIAGNFPGNLAADVLNKVLFYGQTFSVIRENLFSLVLILIAIALAALIIKYVRKHH